MTEFETTPTGERLPTRFAPAYFEMLRDFARDGRLGPQYGDALIARSRGRGVTQ